MIINLKSYFCNEVLNTIGITSTQLFGHSVLLDPTSSRSPLWAASSQLCQCLDLDTVAGNSKKRKPLSMNIVVKKSLYYETNLEQI